jgi:PAS domain S-box-containing protein
LIKQRQYTDDKPKTSITTGNLSHEELEAEVERLWLREAFFDASQKLAHLGYCEWDYDNGRIISCTPAYAEIFGMSIEEVIESQSSWQKVLLQIHPEDRDHYTQSYREHMGKGSHEVEYRIFRKDGAIRHLKEVAILRHDKDRVHKEAIGLVQDVTEQAMMRKQIERQAGLLAFRRGRQRVHRYLGGVRGNHGLRRAGVPRTLSHPRRRHDHGPPRRQ